MASRRKAKPDPETIVNDAQIEAGNAVSETLTYSPLSVPAEMRDAYWQTLLGDPSELRAAIATIEFFPLLKVIPRALWEKRLMVYLYRTAPKVKNSENKKYIEKITEPFDEDYIKENHGGGGYLAYLNLDGEEQLKQISFSIDGPPKIQPGQILVDDKGNPVAPTPATPQQSSEVAQAIEATSAANKLGIEILAKGTEAAMEMQQKAYEKAAGISGNGMHDKLLEMLITKALETPKPQENPTAAALDILDKLDKIVERRTNPREEREPAEHMQLTEVSSTVEALTGKPLSELIQNKGKSDNTPEWISVGISVLGKLVDSLPNILQQISANQERNFQRAIALRNAGQLPPAQPPNPAAPGVPMQPQYVAPVFQPAAPAAPGNVIPMPGVVDPNDVAGQLQGTIKLITQKFVDGYSGGAVAQAVQVVYPRAFDSMASTILDPAELERLVTNVPELKNLSTSPDWPEFLAEFVQFVREEFETDGSDQPAEIKKPVQQPATA